MNQQPPSPKPRLSALEVRKTLDGGRVIGAVTKRTYTVRNGRCWLAEKQVPLAEEPDFKENGLLGHDSDRILQRRLVDVIVEGQARVAVPAPTFTVGIEVGASRREIAVFGERRLVLQPHGGVAISPPVPIAEVPLRWEHAYGGVDHTALEKYGDLTMMLAEKLGEKLDPEQTNFAYPRNPHGRGYLIEASEKSVAATLLPNLEAPDDLLTRDNIVRNDPLLWPKAPRPVATTWLPYVHFPRSLMVGLPLAMYADHLIQPSEFAEVSAAVVPPEAVVPGASALQRVNVNSAQSSALGMRWPEVVPEAPVTLTNIHREASSWSFRLPAEAPRLAYRLPRRGAVVLEPRIRCLQITPDEDRVCVLWVGEHRLDEALSNAQLEGAEYGVKWPEQQ